MKKSFAVIGLGRFGLAIVEELSRYGVDVIALDINKEAVTDAGRFVNHAVVCDCTDEVALYEVGIQNVDHVIIAIGNNISSTILTTVIVQQMGIKKITVRVDNEYYNPVISKLGATEIILPEKSAGARLANRIVYDNFLDYYNVGDYSVVNLLVDRNFQPKTLVDLDLRNRFNINITVIERDQKFFIPKGTDLILPNDQILVIGKKSNIEKFNRYINNN